MYFKLFVSKVNDDIEEAGLVDNSSIERDLALENTPKAVVRKGASR